MARIKQNLSLSEFSERLCSDSLGTQLGQVERKFVHNMLQGVSRSRSVNLTEIAKGLEEKISLHATHKRLSRNLDDPELTANLADRLLKLRAMRINAETRIIVHRYELNKKSARKIEFLSKPDDLLTAGFKVCEILASDPRSQTYLPLLAHIWSDQVPGYVSDSNEVIKAVRQVLAVTGNKGMLYFDYSSITKEVLAPFMLDQHINYIMLVPDNNVEVSFHKKNCSMEEMLSRVETRYGKILYKLVPAGMVSTSTIDLDLYMHVGSIGVKLPASMRSLSFISLKTKSSLSYLGEYATALLTTRTGLRSRKALMGLIDSFLSIQDILEMHRTLRDSFNPGNFRVLTYNRLQLLMTLLESVIHYELAIKGNELVSEKKFSPKPHNGQFERTYLLPT
jgi:hypothetical protein